MCTTLLVTLNQGAGDILDWESSICEVVTSTSFQFGFAEPATQQDKKVEEDGTRPGRYSAREKHQLEAPTQATCNSTGKASDFLRI